MSIALSKMDRIVKTPTGMHEHFCKKLKTKIVSSHFDIYARTQTDFINELDVR